jgi:hypothetical protein
MTPPMYRSTIPATSTTCEIVPLNPNELTPAYRERLVFAVTNFMATLGNSIGSSCTDSATLLFRATNCALGGAVSCISARIAENSPAIPDAASKCPMLAFTLDTSSGCSRSRPLQEPYTAAKAPVSMGSPKPVPVPCASTYDTSLAAIFASRNAARISFSCASPFGAVKLALRPSCITADPLITA